MVELGVEGVEHHFVNIDVHAHLGVIFVGYLQEIPKAFHTALTDSDVAARVVVGVVMAFGLVTFL